MSDNQNLSTYPQGIVLASASSSRKKLMEKYNIPFKIIPSDFDEEKAKEEYKEYPLIRLVEILAIGKAESVSLKNPNQLIIGADQMVEFQSKRLDKPYNINEVEQSIRLLNGQKHHLLTACVIIQNGQILFKKVQDDTLEIKKMTEDEINTYIQNHGQNCIGCVGGFQIEKTPQIFKSQDYDTDTIQGLPMTDIIQFLNSLKGR